MLQRSRTRAHQWTLVRDILPARASLETFATRLVSSLGGAPLWIEQAATVGAGQGTVTVCYAAVVGARQVTGTDWHSVRHLPAMREPQRSLIRFALGRLHACECHHALARHLLPRDFTLGELQRLYEALEGRVLVRANFRREVNAAKRVVPTGRMRRPARGRPAQLFAFGTRPERRTPASRGAGPGSSAKEER